MMFTLTDLNRFVIYTRSSGAAFSFYARNILMKSIIDEEGIMSRQDRIDVDIFKVVSKAIATSDDLEIMTSHLSQLLVAALEIKGCALFILNAETKELEMLASSGLGADYLAKGPLLADKSIASAFRGEGVILRDISLDDQLQYPEAARQEGIAAILSIPIVFSGEVLGVLRLYHHEVWDISERDFDSLLVLAENIGLSLRYTRLLNALQSVNEALAGIGLPAVS